MAASRRRRKRRARTDYDSAWKRALTNHFEACILFFFPHIHAEIDWERRVEFLDNALRAIIGGKKSRNRHADKLVKVFLKTGEPRWLLIHIEVQTQFDPAFPKRMFHYYYRAFDRYDVQVVSLAILADLNPNWRPDRYETEKWGCSAMLRYPIVKLNDWRGKWAELERSKNPFAFVVMAFLKTQDSAGDGPLRFRFKLELTRSLYASGFKKEDIEAIFSIIDSFMTLPDNLSRKFDTKVDQILEEPTMPFVSALERAYQRRGKRIGEKLGRARGVREAVIQVIKSRFGKVPGKIAKSIASEGDVGELQEMLVLAANAKSLDEISESRTTHSIASRRS